MKTNRRESKFFTMMVIESLTFTGITLVFMGIIAIVMFYFLIVYKAEDFYAPFLDNQEVIERGEYDKINVEKQLGKGSVFYVFNDEKEEIYSSNKDRKYPFDMEETELIPQETADINVKILKFKDDSGRELEKIEHENYNGKILLVVIIDKDNNIIFTSNKTIGDRLSENEHQCIMGKNKEYMILREVFIGEDKKEYTIVFFNHIDRIDNFDTRLIKLAGGILAMIIAVLFISTGIFWYRVDKKVNKPILLLENAINDFKIGKENDPIKYKGPKEFVEICDKFNDMAKRLNESQKENSKMLGDISHDLKTPITVLQSYARAINDGLVHEGDRREYLESIYEKSEELEKLVNMFSEYSKLSRSDYKLNLERVDVVEFMRDYLISKYNELEFLQFNLVIDMVEDECICNIDGFQMKRALENIISNSIKHNSKGTSIYVKVAREDGMVSVRIGDDGKGIDKELREKIFKAFVTGNVARTDVKSSGLGLSIVKKIIELHKGSVKLMDESQSDIAVEFDIRIPII